MTQIAAESAPQPAQPAIAALDLPDNVLPLPGLSHPLPGSGLRPGDAVNRLPTRNLRPLGQILLEDGVISPDLLLKATVLRRRQDARLGEILLAHGWVTPEALTRALSRQWRTNMIDLAATPPDPRLIDQAGADFCLTHAIVPCRQTGGVTWVATARPEAFAALQDKLPAAFGSTRMLLCSEVQAQDAILNSRRTRLTRSAESRVSRQESCRKQDTGRSARIALAVMALLAVGLALAPVAVMAVVAGWAILTLAAATVLKALCFRASLAGASERAREAADLAAGRRTPPQMSAPLPRISVMVPMFAESDIAQRLVGRLARLTYPRELTDILLVVEECDRITRNALAHAGLPPWIRVVTVPDGPIRTKPRALNYALNFCRGQIIGVWDAEDQPEPDQLHKVARHFHFAPEDVACLQGALDFYNPRTNWLARCFTVEYASWFRGILPGAARLGLVIPLGGTTLFCRRGPLEEVGAWDAWNVTEDADLGVRLARRGYRTEMIDTTTDEEANCRTLPWIKQRSRWIKGHALTWAVHMRNPRLLLRELGPRRFIAFQVQFLCPLSQYLLAPVLLSFWLILLGLPHPLAAPMAGLWSGYAIPAAVTLLLAAEALNIAIGLWTVRGAKRGHLRPWVLTLHLYHPIGCFAGWKAIYEAVVKPFYWDKTVHGVFDAVEADADQTPGAVVPGTVAIPLLGALQDSRATPRQDDAFAGIAPEAMLAVAANLLGSGRVTGSADAAGGLTHGELVLADRTLGAGLAKIGEPLPPLARATADQDGADPLTRRMTAQPMPRHFQLSFMRRRREAG